MFNPKGDGDSDDGELTITKHFKQVALFKEGADIVEFDDKFKDDECASELVFSIIVNRYVLIFQKCYLLQF